MQTIYLLYLALRYAGKYEYHGNYRGAPVVRLIDRKLQAEWRKQDLCGFAMAGVIVTRTKKLAQDPAMLRHEYTHVEQGRNDLLFSLKYTYYHYTRPYEENPYEVEAVRAENSA